MKHRMTQNDLLCRLSHARLSLLRELGNLADEDGQSLYLVGGVVRDLLLKRENWDLDLTVEGDGIAFARLVADRYGAGLAVFERFATARLVFPDGLKMDIATTRRESYAQPAILPMVQPASIEEDLYRRDFTINAMAMQLNPGQFGRLLDPYGGQRDLRARTIRVLHSGSFQDDPTRIFRAIRFEQRFGFHLERTTLRLLAQAASTNLIQQLSGPRLQNEILLLFAERDPVRAIARLAQLKLLRFLHRRLCYTTNVKRTVTAVPKALAWWTRRFPDSAIDRPIVYLMALSSESSPVVVAAMIRRLVLSREQAKNVNAGGRRVDRALKRLTNRRGNTAIASVSPLGRSLGRGARAASGETGKQAARGAIETAETTPFGVCEEQDGQGGTDGAGSSGPGAEARAAVHDDLGEIIGRAN